MNDRKRIAEMISEILSDRKSYRAVPSGTTEHIVKCIEHPGGSKAVYRTGSLIEYVSRRNMRLVLVHEDAGYRKAVADNSDIHEAIRFCLDYYGYSDSELSRYGIEYRYPAGASSSLSIDRCCEILDRLNVIIVIENNEGD